MNAHARLGIRRHNVERVRAVLHGSVALTRSEIASRTGLSRATITSIVAELLRSGDGAVVAPETVAEIGRGAGRRAELVALVRPPTRALALDLAHESVRVGVVGERGTIRTSRAAALSSSTSAEEAVAVTQSLVTDVLDRSQLAIDDVSAIVAAVPDPIDGEGNTARPDPLSRWDGRNPQRELTAALGRPVLVENDANLAVIGETMYGAARGLADAIYVKVAHGVGTGILVNGQLVAGASHLAGEVGHIQVRPDGRICSCGNRGCLFTLVTDHYLTPLLGKDPRDARSLADLGIRDDAGARRLLKDAGHEVGRAMSNIVNALNPAAVVLGGRLAHAGDALALGFQSAIERYAEPQVVRALTITVTGLREGAELLGAAAVGAGVAPPLRRTTAGPSQAEALRARPTPSR